LGLKAPLNSPALTGTPTVPTATLGTNTTQAASTAFVKAANDAVISNLPTYTVVSELPSDLSGYPDGSRIVVTG
jgi:hypothetical protein